MEDVPVKVGPDTCLKCRRGFIRHDRVIEVKLVAGVANHPNGSGQTLWVSETIEYGHESCRTQQAPPPLIELPHPRLKPAMPEPLRARSPSFKCAQCRKMLIRGDRIVTVYIVEGTAMDPELNMPAVQCSCEFEADHFDCRDPQMEFGSMLEVGA